MQIQDQLVDLPYLLPSSYGANEKMSDKKILKREAVVDLWKSIIIGAKGFDENNELKSELILSIKEKVSSFKINNYASFCRAWCKEILPNLDKKILESQTIDRLSTFFKKLAIEFVEGDTTGTVNRISETKFYPPPPTTKDFWEYTAFAIDLLKNAFFSLKNIALPWFVTSTMAAFSRYRKSRQCIVGGAILKARVHHHASLNTIDKKKLVFEELQVTIKRSYCYDNEMQDETARSLSDIKKITSQRLWTIGAAMVTVPAIIMIVKPIFLFISPVLFLIGSTVLKTGDGNLIQTLAGFVALIVFVGGAVLMQDFSNANFLARMLVLAVIASLIFGSIALSGYMGTLIYPAMLAKDFGSVLLAGVELVPILLGFSVTSKLSLVFQRFEIYINRDLLPWQENEMLNFPFRKMSEMLDFSLDKLLGVVDGFSPHCS